MEMDDAKHYDETPRYLTFMVLVISNFVNALANLVMCCILYKQLQISFPLTCPPLMLLFLYILKPVGTWEKFVCA